MIRRIHILGSSGSGKTCIATELSRRLRIPAFDLDDLFWDRAAPTYGIRTAPRARERQLARIVAADEWIVEGAYYQWLAPSFDRAELIVALATPVWLRDVRIVRRFVRRKLGIVPSKRETLADLWQLLCWNHRYDHNNLPKAMQFVRDRGLTPVVCRSLEDVIQCVDRPAPAAARGRKLGSGPSEC